MPDKVTLKAGEFEDVATPAPRRATASPTLPFDPYQRVRERAPKFGVDPELAAKIMTRESGGKHYRNGKVLSSESNARGLMQVLPATGRARGYNVDDPYQNIDAGLAYLGEGTKQYNGDPALVAAGYFAGYGNAEKALKNPKGNPKTRDYARGVAGDDAYNTALERVGVKQKQGRQTITLRPDEFEEVESEQVASPANEAAAPTQEITTDANQPPPVTARINQVPSALDVDFSDYVKSGKPPTHVELSKRIYDKMGFNDEEAAAYATALGRDVPNSFYEAADPAAAAASILERAKGNDRGLASIAGLTKEALGEKQQWLNDYRDSKVRALPSADRERMALEIAKTRPLIDRERKMLGFERGLGGQLFADAFTGGAGAVGSMLKGVDVLADMGGDPTGLANILKNLGITSPQDLSGAFGDKLTEVAKEGRNLKGGQGTIDDAFSVFGGAVPYVAGGFAGAPVAATMGALGNAGDLYNEARAAGASERTAGVAGLIGAPIGALEGLLGLGKTGSKVAAAEMKGIVETVLREVGGEFTQEGVQAGLNGLVAKGIYDPKREWLQIAKDTGYNALLGAITGGILGGGTHAASRGFESVANRGRRGVNEQETQSASVQGEATGNQSDITAASVRGNALDGQRSNAEAIPPVNDQALPVDSPVIARPEVQPMVEGQGQPPVGFKTSKGSTYIVNPDGTTTRNKSYHPEHGEKDQGIQPQSEKTYYVSRDDAIKLGEFQAQGEGRVVAEHKDGRIGVKYTTGRDAGKFESRTMVMPKAAPEAGLIPVESFSGGERVHFGNEITEVQGDRRIVAGNAPKATGERRAGEIVSESPQTVPTAKRILNERRTAERAADTDPLTGVANRRALDKALPAAEADPSTAVISFDANNFGQVNKLQGEVAGDEMLKGLTDAVTQAAKEVSPQARVFRRGGDEIVVLAPKDVAEQVRTRAEEIFGEREISGEYEGQQKTARVSLSGSVGDTFKDANAPLQSAKASRKALAQPRDEATKQFIKPQEAITNEPTPTRKPGESLPLSYLLGKPAISKESLSKGDVLHDINNANGEKVGVLQVEINGEKAYVKYLGQPDSEGNEYQNLSNKLGAKGLRDLLRQFQQAHPEVKTIEGMRQGGTFYGNPKEKSKQLAPLVKEQPPGETGGRGSESDGIKERSLPKTLEAHDLAGGNDRIYRVVGNEESVKTARENISSKGVDGAAEFVRSSKDPSAEVTATGIAAIDEYQRQALAETDKTKKAALYQKANDVAGDLSAKLTRAGQAIQAAKLVEEFGTSQAIITANRIAEKRGRELTPEQTEEIAKQAVKLEEATKRVRELEEIVAGYETKKQGKTAERKQAIAKGLNAAETAARERLAKLIKPERAARTSPASQGAISFGGTKVSPQTVSDLAAVQAAKVHAGDKPLAEIRKEMSSEFGADYDAVYRRVEREADTILRKANKRPEEVLPSTRKATARQELGKAARDAAKWDAGIREDAANAPDDLIAQGTALLADILASGKGRRAWETEMSKRFGKEYDKNARTTYVQAYERIKAAKQAHTEYGAVLRAHREGAVTQEQVKVIQKRLEEARDIHRNANLDLARQYDHLAGGRWWNIVSGVRKAGLLSSIRTHLRNVVSNTAYQTFDEVSRIPAVVVDFAVASKTGQRAITGASPAAALDSILTGLTKGGKEALDIMKHGMTAEQAAKLQLPEELNGGVKIIDATSNFVFRAMAAGDRVFYNGSLKRNTIDRAKAQALTEVRESKIKHRDVTSRMREIVKDPPDELLANAKHDALVATFNNSNKLSDAIRRARSQAPPVVNFAIDLVMPFDRTPTNVLARTLEASPTGFLKAATGGYKKSPLALAKSIINKTMTVEEQRQFSQTMGRATTGTSIITLGFMLGAKGLMSAFYDEDDDYQSRTQNRKLKEQGKSPMALKVGNQWVSIGDTNIGNLLAIGATLQKEIAEGKDTADKTLAPFKAAKDVMLEQPMLSSAKDLVKAGEDVKGKGANYAGRLVSSFIPAAGFVRDIATAGDSTARKTFGFGGQIKSSIPGWRNTLPEDVGIEHRRSWFIDPFRMKTDRGGGGSSSGASKH